MEIKEITENLSKLPKAAPNAIKHARGQEHNAKAFADDLIINCSRRDHKSSLLVIDSACRVLGLSLNLSKCVSLFLTNGQVDPNAVSN